MIIPKQITLYQKISGMRLMREWFINVAVSFDGKISNPGEQVQISSNEDWKIVHNMRNTIAAIVIGSGTVIVDNPSLMTKSKYIDGVINHPVRVILDRSGRCSPESKVFKNQNITKTIWITESDEIIEDIFKIKTSDITNIIMEVENYLDSINKKGNIMIEGGSQIINNFINSGKIKKMRVFRGNIILPNGIPLFTNKLTKQLKLVELNSIGDNNDIGSEELYTFY